MTKNQKVNTNYKFAKFANDSINIKINKMNDLQKQFSSLKAVLEYIQNGDYKYISFFDNEYIKSEDYISHYFIVKEFSELEDDSLLTTLLMINSDEANEIITEAWYGNKIVINFEF